MRRVVSAVLPAAALIVAALPLSGCGGGVSPASLPIPAETKARMQKMGLRENAPIFVRIFKRESELEIWKQRDDGRYALLKTYPICKWSGDLGPKVRMGDKQAPEGFYTVAGQQMNPRSSYHLSFNLGFPNALDQAYQRTGDYLMVHGDCRSAGCYAMTDALIEEIYAIAREALAGGQEKFQVQALPFRMSDENMKRYADKRWQAFWGDLKRGYDAFELTRLPPKIDVCERRYLVNVSFGEAGRSVGASDACPPHRAFLPDIVETPQGPRIIEADASTATTFRAASREAAGSTLTAGHGDGRPVGAAALATPQDLALRQSLSLSR